MVAIGFNDNKYFQSNKAVGAVELLCILV